MIQDCQWAEAILTRNVEGQHTQWLGEEDAQLHLPWQIGGSACADRRDGHLQTAHWACQDLPDEVRGKWKRLGQIGSKDLPADAAMKRRLGWGIIGEIYVVSTV